MNYWIGRKKEWTISSGADFSDPNKKQGLEIPFSQGENTKPYPTPTFLLPSKIAF